LFFPINPPRFRSRDEACINLLMMVLLLLFSIIPRFSLLAELPTSFSSRYFCADYPPYRSPTRPFKRSLSYPFYGDSFFFPLPNPFSLAPSPSLSANLSSCRSDAAGSFPPPPSDHQHGIRPFSNNSFFVFSSSGGCLRSVPPSLSPWPPL